MDRAELLKKIMVAKKEVSEALAHLEKVLGEIEVAPRAEKTAVSAVVREAFEKVNSAKATLEGLERIVERMRT